MAWALSLTLAAVRANSACFGDARFADGLLPPPIPSPILCIGDSLTYGEGGNGVTYPTVLSSLASVPTVNLGLSGWIPRHIVYYVLLHEQPFISVEQLRGIPPSEYENRRNQPTINTLRTFLRDGQTVWVGEKGNPTGMIQQYQWDGAAATDDATTISPLAVGDASHRPYTPVGRWRIKTTPGSGPPETQVYSGIIFCIGANGMEADDIKKSLATLMKLLSPPEGHFLVLGLMNRVDPNRRDMVLGDWAKWIGECNRSIEADYPGHLLDLQAWVTSSGIYQGRGFRTSDWVKSATPEQLALDASYQAMGILPNTLRTPGNTTHLNAIGYSIIGNLTYEWIVLHGWLGTGEKAKK
jgi:hypothetical protein